MIPIKNHPSNIKEGWSQSILIYRLNNDSNAFQTIMTAKSKTTTMPITAKIGSSPAKIVPATGRRIKAKPANRAKKYNQ